MKLYHGAKTQFDAFKTPTGNCNGDILNGGVVYLTSDFSRAKKYSGKFGYVATVEVKNPLLYSEELAKRGLKKQRKYVENVYVAKPVDCLIVDWDF